MDFEHGFVVTGSIGCGKSSFCSYLREYGYEIIDADKMAHEELQLAHDSVVGLFGDAVVKNGMVDRKAVGAVVFADGEARKKLEKLLHPRIKQAILSKAIKLEKSGKPYFVDIPLYYETANYEAKNVIVVYAPRDVQLERLTKQKGMAMEEAEARINSQIDIEKKRELASIVIDNSSDMASLKMQTKDFIRGLKQ